MTEILIILLAPLSGFFINSFIGKHKKISGLLGCGAVFLSFACSLSLLWKDIPKHSVVLFSWLKWEALNVSFSFLIDPLSLTMVLIITGVGSLIHWFSLEYMKDDPRIGRYFSYLNLFIFSMLILVLADNLLLMFVGWEGVGLCSYLLIGFWHQKKEKSLAGMKAFIMNRIGDIGFIIGLILFFVLFNSLDFSAIDSKTALNSPLLSLALCLCLLFGAAGKSAQIPLYTWLPSAMAGPTPVSALIHAATMVTAGIYLIIRTQGVWEAAPTALYLTAFLGAATALTGAYLACRVWDVKKILAYSTISQLGYMFLALGVGAFSTGFFHLLTHAFFKAGLFLSAGSLIHALHGQQDIRHMGSFLRKKMPFTFISFLIGGLALMGIPPLSGFFSKDEILYYTFHEKHYFLWGIALLGAGLTAFYTTRTLYFIFWKPTEKVQNTHKESWIMTTPLMILAIFSIFAGLINWPAFMPQIIPFHWLHHILGFPPHSSTHVFLELCLAGISILVVLMTAGTYLFFRNQPLFSTVKHCLKPCQKVLAWSLDEFYTKYLAHFLLKTSESLTQHFEISFLQKGIKSIGKYFSTLRQALISFQNGQIQVYLLFMGVGFLLFITAVLMNN